MYFDLLIGGILLLGAVRGAKKGIVWQLAVIAAIVLCFLFAESGSQYIAPLFPVEAPLNRWLAMLALYVGLALVCFAVARVLRGWIEKAKFEEFDRHLGALLGLLKGAVFALVLIFFVVTISERLRGQVMNSYSGYAAAIVMDRLHPVMPEELHAVLEPYIHQLDRPDLDLKRSHVTGHSPAVQGPRSDPSGEVEIGPDRSGSPVDALFEQLRARIGQGADGLRQLFERAMMKTPPEKRAELLEDIRTADPESIRAILSAWLQERPAVEPAPAADEDLLAQRAELLQAVAAVFSEFPGARAAIIGELSRALSGVPDRVAVAVLRDWHADLTGAASDPDPQTDRSATLDERIVRQMAAAGIPLSTLDGPVRERLGSGLRL